MGNAIYNFNAQKGILHLIAQSLSLDIVGFSPMTVKKVLAGSGKAEKEEMILAAKEFSKRDIKNHNEADAIGVLATYLKGE
jgi:Holliday junction resolvasome RuvABC endonuclease subunit